MHSNDIVNLLKLDSVRFINLEELGDTITLFFKRIDNRMLCECSCSKLYIHNWRNQTLLDLPIHGKTVKLVVSKQRYHCLDIDIDR